MKSDLDSVDGKKLSHDTVAGGNDEGRDTEPYQEWRFRDDGNAHKRYGKQVPPDETIESQISDCSRVQGDLAGHHQLRSKHDEPEGCASDLRGAELTDHSRGQ